MTHPAYEHNNVPVSREAFYAIACDPRRSVAVEACAGAGKTWMLVSRIVRALLDGCPAHEILAITFTKKAAGEMRARLHEWLAEFAQTPIEDLALQLQIRGISDEIVLKRTPDLREQLQNLQQNLLATGRPVQIRTFHSWFAALLRTAPLAVLQGMGLPARYELLEDDADAVAHVWLPFYTAVLADAELKADYLAVVSAHGRAQTHKALAGALARRVEFALADEAGVVDASVQAWDVQFSALAGHASPGAWLVSEGPRAQLLAAARALGQAGAKTFAAKGGELEVAVSGADAAGICDALLTQKGEPRKFGEKIVGIDQVRLAQDLVLQYNAANTQQEAWDYQQRMARLARVLVAAFAALKRARGWVDMNDVERAAQTMLSDSVLSGWMQERLDARVRHLLIDEFQDTNPLQWQALHAWLSGYAGTGGGAQRPSVFIVGDPKQSIYRFRRAEPQVFRAAQAFVVDGLGGDRLSCDHTRRNAPGIIDAVNQTMATAQAAGAYSDFRTHTTESTAAASVLCLPQIGRGVLQDPAEAEEGDPPEHGALAWRDSLATPREVPEETLRTLECRQAAQWLVATMAQHGLKPKDVMVLSRRRVNLGVMRDALRDLHVPTQQPEKNDLADAPEVQDMLALLDVLVSPAHDLSLARALRSPLWSLGDDDLVHIALAQRRAREAPPGSGDTSWWGLLQNDELLPQSIRALAPVLVLYKRWVDQLPPHDALDAIYQHGDVLARFAAAAPATLRAGVLDNLRTLLGAALNHAGGRYATPYGFVRALKAGGTKAGATAAADANGAGAVRLLTVHGAKGLEAELVLLLDTDGQAAKSESMGVLVDWPGESAAPERFLFLVRETNPPACAVAALQTEQAARQREELNGLYVAMTRAVRQLVLSSVEPHRGNPGSWWQRVHGLCAPADAAAPESALPSSASHEVSAGSFLLKILPFAHIHTGETAINNIAEDATAPLQRSVPSSAESRVGQAMHRLLEWAPLGVNPAAHCVAGRAAVAREFSLDATQSTLAAEMAQRILQGTGAWAWQADTVDWHGNEVALVASGALVRLDRLVRRSDTGAWWVLDYKSAGQPQHQADLRDQLLAYRAAVQALQPDAVVHAAFLTGQGALEVLD